MNGEAHPAVGRLDSVQVQNQLGVVEASLRKIADTIEKIRRNGAYSLLPVLIHDLEDIGELVEEVYDSKAPHVAYTREENQRLINDLPDVKTGSAEDDDAGKAQA